MSATSLREPGKTAPAVGDAAAAELQRASSFVASAKTWRQLGRLLTSRDRRLLGVAAMAMIIGSFATASVPLMVGQFVDAVSGDGRLVALTKAARPLLALLASYVVINAAEVVRHQTLHRVTTSFDASARCGIYARLLRWDLKCYRDRTDGAIYGRANRSVEGAERLIKLGAGEVLPAVLVAAFAVAMAIVRFGAVGVLMSGVIPTGFLLVSWQTRSQNGVRLMVKEGKERIDGSVSSWLAMLKVIRTTGTEAFFDRRIQRETSNLSAIELRHHIAMSLFDAAKTFNEALWLLGTMIVAIKFNLAKSPGDLTGVVLIYLAITKPLRELHRIVDESSEAALAATDLLHDLARAKDESFSPGPRPVIREKGTSDVSERGIRFEDLTFRYPNTSSDVLRGLSAHVRHGERVGLVGASGCGKSTLLDLIARLHHGYGGSITLDGQPVADIPREDLAHLIGYVGQEPMLFPGTIRDNLVMGRRGITDRHLVQACQDANIHDDIQRMPGGYGATLAQKGSNLSGGQRQRLCIARALLCTPPFMLLDEPTSALDAPSQSAVQDAIDQLRDVTMLIVAHRLSTLRTMDRILVVSEGRVVEQGSYDSLAAAGGHFAQMLTSERRHASGNAKVTAGSGSPG